MKRVYCLYRVSTAQQVDVVKDDIPMQRIACHDFAARMGWTILVEKEEKGISGFKVSAEKRDAIQELKEAALHKEFDVLLVFMFDRLGRIENETPFVLEWFADHGIEVWSVNEGQQMLRIFATSGLFRPNKSPDYYECTAIKALRSMPVKSTYTPTIPKNTGGNGKR